MKNNINSLEEAVNIYAKAIGINEDAIILTERAAERDAMSIQEAEKFLNDIRKACMSKTDSLEQIDERINCLESAVKKLKIANNSTGERIKYPLKALIPFNGLARLIDKQHDAFGFLADAGAYVAGSIIAKLTGGVIFVDVISAGIRAGTYEQMMDHQIEKTEKAIEYLRDQREKIKKEK